MRPLLERAALRLDAPPLGELIRFMVGWTTAALWMSAAGEAAPSWPLFAIFAGILIAYRLVPLLLRRMFRFSDPTRAVWYERRQLAKRFDSYQWQKLFWFGLGMSTLQVVRGSSSGALLALTSACVVGGGVGLVIWQYRRVQLRASAAGFTGVRK